MHHINSAYIFVYGTLSSEGSSPESRLLIQNAEFIGHASFQGKLYNVSYYPGAVISENPEDKVYGEVYLLHNADFLLPMLDRYEEYGPDFTEPNEYLRKQQAVCLDKGGWIIAWVYIYNRPVDGLDLASPLIF